MNDDDYIDDATELVIDAGEFRGAPDEERTNPLRAAAPASVRELYEADARAVEGKAVQRSTFSLADLGLEPDVDPDATRERAVLPPPPLDREEETVVRPAPQRPPARQPPRPQVPRPAAPLPQRGSPSSSHQAVRPAPTALQPRPDRAPEPAARTPNRDGTGTAGLQLPEAPRLSAAAAPDASEQLRRLGLTRKKKASAQSIRPRSGFYSLPEANPGEVIPDVTVEHVFVDEDRNRALLGLVVAVGAGTAAAVGLLSLALSRWSSPVEMMTWTLLAMVLLAGVVAGVSLPDDDLKVDGLRRAFLPMGIATALALVSGLVWQIGPLRAELRWIAATTPEMSRKVMSDKSIAVALAECKRVADKAEIGTWRDVLLDTLVGRDALGRRCLEELPAETAELLSATLVDRWHTELLQLANEQRACDVADTLTTLPRPEGEIETRLLSCVLTAPSADVQHCCGVSLAAFTAQSNGDWVANVAATEAYAPDGTTAAGLMTLAFHQEGVTAAQREFVEASKFTGAEARRGALAIACDAVRAGAQGLGQHFSASLGGGCPVEVTRVPAGREVWLTACDVALADIERGAEPEKALCEATKSALVVTAVSDASRIIVNAAADRTSAAQVAYSIDVEANTAALRGEKPQIRTVADDLERRGKRSRSSESDPLGNPSFKMLPTYRGLSTYENN